jgi:two-component system nitrate/nitrite response regulator NarL
MVAGQPYDPELVTRPSSMLQVVAMNMEVCYLLPSSPQSQKVSFRPREASSWVVPKPRKPENKLQAVSDPGPAFQVLIVDRDSMSSDLLATRLTRDRNFQALGVRSASLLDRLANGKAHLVVIGADLNDEAKSGFELAHTVRGAHPTLPIVILLNQSTHDSVIQAFRSGARGVFSRQQPVADFIDCVEHVRKGFIWAGAQETTFLLDAFRSIPSPNLSMASKSSTLTVRELQVVKCAARGKTNKVIAGELRLSEHTVKNYLFRAFEKLGVSNRIELLFYLTLRGHTFDAGRTDDPQSELRAG